MPAARSRSPHVGEGDRRPQLRLDFGWSPSAPRREAFVVSSVLRRHPAVSEVERKLRYCLGYFPELAGRPFGLGLTRQAQGLASLEDFAIWLNPTNLALQTIAHELIHLLQASGTIPAGERSCDVYSLARHPSLNDARPNYLDVPDSIFDERRWTRRGWSTILYRTARRALDERARGRRNYIRWFEDQLCAATRSRSVEERQPS